jgi:hypothetical protein
MAHRIHVDTRAYTVTRQLRLAIVTMSLLVLTSCAAFTGRYYSAEPIKARVVDRETKKPIAGVVVVANWILMRPVFHGRLPVGTMQILETVTDANGDFTFPAWGPLENTTDGYLDHEDPRLSFFKPEYYLGSIANDSAETLRGTHKPSRRRSDWNGKTIELEKFSGTVDEYAEDVTSRSNRLLHNPNANLAFLTLDCHFMKTPLLAEAIDREVRSLAARGHKRGGFTFDSIPREDAAKCGLVRPPGMQ